MWFCWCVVLLFCSLLLCLSSCFPLVLFSVVWLGEMCILGFGCGVGRFSFSVSPFP